MDIKTKLNVQEDAWFMCSNKTASAEVTSIEIEVCETGQFYQITTNIIYGFQDNARRHESEVFATKAELLASL